MDVLGRLREQLRFSAEDENGRKRRLRRATESKLLN